MRLHELREQIERANTNDARRTARCSFLSALVSRRRALGLDNDVLELLRSNKKIVASLGNTFPEANAFIAEFATYPLVAAELNPDMAFNMEEEDGKGKEDEEDEEDEEGDEEDEDGAEEGDEEEDEEEDEDGDEDEEGEEEEGDEEEGEEDAKELPKRRTIVAPRDPLLIVIFAMLILNMVITVGIASGVDARAVTIEVLERFRKVLSYSRRESW
jgi:hypothetical protein